MIYVIYDLEFIIFILQFKGIIILFIFIFVDEKIYLKMCIDFFLKGDMVVEVVECSCIVRGCCIDFGGGVFDGNVLF